ncbi:MAG: hypothetical protein ACE5K1_00165 [Acidiferrobacterales bacterium]
MKKSLLLLSMCVAFAGGTFVSMVTTNRGEAATISASEAQQLKAKLNRVANELAKTKHELVDLRRRYLGHTHSLNVTAAPAPEVPSLAVQGPKVRLLVHIGNGNPTITGAPQ